MPAYRLRSDVLRDAARGHGDRTVGSIIRRTGLSKTVIWRALNGSNEPSTGTLMRFNECYAVPVESLVYKIEDGEAAA